MVQRKNGESMKKNSRYLNIWKFSHNRMIRSDFLIQMKQKRQLPTTEQINNSSKGLSPSKFLIKWCFMMFKIHNLRLLLLVKTLTSHKGLKKCFCFVGMDQTRDGWINMLAQIDSQLEAALGKVRIEI